MKKRGKPGKRTVTTVSRVRPIRNSPNPIVSVIIPAMNERRTIASVVYQASRVHPETEVIVVANGSTDGTMQVAEQAGARVIEFAQPLGHDVGRSIGAMAAKGEILLFTDGDIIIPATRLKPFVRAVQQGTDIALNRYMGPMRVMNEHPVVLSKCALNLLLARPELRAASMTTIPHAISRRALEVIGCESLAVPPKAQAMAHLNGLAVQSVHYVGVGRSNPRKRLRFRRDPLEGLIVGDHLEALHWWMEHTDPRGGHTDLGRVREGVRA